MIPHCGGCEIEKVWYNDRKRKEKEMMKFRVFSVSWIGDLSYVGTWYANSYDAVASMVFAETGMSVDNLKIYGHI